MNNRNYSHGFRIMVVKDALTNGLSRRQSAHKHGIGYSTLGKWLAEDRDHVSFFSKHDKTGLAKPSFNTATPLEEQVRDLTQRLDAYDNIFKEMGDLLSRLGKSS